MLEVNAGGWAPRAYVATAYITTWGHHHRVRESCM